MRLADDGVRSLVAGTSDELSSHAPDMPPERSGSPARAAASLNLEEAFALVAGTVRDLAWWVDKAGDPTDEPDVPARQAAKNQTRHHEQGRSNGGKGRNLRHKINSQTRGHCPSSRTSARGGWMSSAAGCASASTGRDQSAASWAQAVQLSPTSSTRVFPSASEAVSRASPPARDARWRAPTPALNTCARGTTPTRSSSVGAARSGAAPSPSASGSAGRGLGGRDSVFIDEEDYRAKQDRTNSPEEILKIP